MKRLNIHEAKTHLSRYLARLKPGERILLCKRHRPIAEIRSLPTARTSPRPLGLAQGDFQITEAFFEPLPSEIQEAFDQDSS